VLVSELSIEPGAELRDLHRRVLAGDAELAAPVPVLAQAAPQRSAPQEMPPTVPGFTGRSAELRTLTRLLGRADEKADEKAGKAAVISAIAGTAGVGKTALAVQWAHHVAERFPDGQLYANLRGYDGAGEPALPADVARRFLNALGIPDGKIPADPEALASAYRSTLAGRRVLIVLDNARDAAQVRPLLPGGPGCCVLVTSRSKLTSLVASEGAFLLTLDLLSQPDAHALLTKRLGQRRAADEPEAVSELAGLCARLPLAIGIAAARAAARPTLPLACLAAELRDAGSRLDLLDAGDPCSSIRTVFSLSYQGLSDGAARMFRLLSVHPGPDITIPAAASLTGMTRGAASQAIGELCGSHLLAEHAHGRFAFHDLLRAYAADLAGTQDRDADRDAAVRRLLDHYLHTGDVVLRLLDPTLDPIGLAAPQPGTFPEAPASYEQGWAWALAEQQVLLRIASRAAKGRFAARAWQILYAVEPFFLFWGLWHEFASVQRAALNAAVRTEDVAGQAHMHRGLGRIYALLGSAEEAQAHLSRAIAGFRKSGDRSGEARARISMGRALSVQGRYAEALSQARQALCLYRAAGHLGGQAGALNNIGVYHAHLGGYQEAVEYCGRSLARCSELGNRHGMAYALDGLGSAYQLLDQHALAIACYQLSLDASRQHGNRHLQADALTRLGDTHHATGNLPAARCNWQAALDILSEMRHPDASEIRHKLTNLASRALPCPTD
jgi:tetratricopeptide (TPR) repeat protein